MPLAYLHPGDLSTSEWLMLAMYALIFIGIPCAIIVFIIVKVFRPQKP